METKTNCYYKDPDSKEYVFIVHEDILPFKKRQVLISGIEKITGRKVKELASTAARIVKEPVPAAEETVPVTEDISAVEVTGEEVKRRISQQGDSAFVYFTEMYNNGIPFEDREEVRNTLNRYAVGRILSITEEEIVALYKKDPVFFNSLFNAMVSKKHLLQYSLQEKAEGRKPTQKGCLLWISAKYREQQEPRE